VLCGTVVVLLCAWGGFVLCAAFFFDVSRLDVTDFLFLGSFLIFVGHVCDVSSPHTRCGVRSGASCILCLLCVDLLHADGCCGLIVWMEWSGCSVVVV